LDLQRLNSDKLIAVEKRYNEQIADLQVNNRLHVDSLEA
jgi:hypothetical protein